MKRLSYGYVKDYIESFDYTLLSNSYKNISTKLKVRCPKDHEYEVAFNKFQQGRRCPVCAIKKSGDSQRLDYEYVKNYIESFDYTLLSDSYKNVNTKLKLRCPKGHEYEVNFKNFKIGKNRCPICAGKKKFSYDQVKQYVEKEGYTLLSDSYINGKTKLKLRCPKGHDYDVTFNNFKNHKKRCAVCAGNKKLTYDQVKEYIESFGYTLLSDNYVNSATKLKLRCPKGHEYEMTFGSFKYCGYRCPICNSLSTSSKAERYIAAFVKELLPDNKVICNDRTQIINPLTGYYLELDVFIPELNKAIEFNGLYWHSFKETKIKDKIKKEQCKEKNIDLMIIDEKQWMDNQESVIKLIENFCLT